MTDAHNGLRLLTRRAAGCNGITRYGMACPSEIPEQPHRADLRGVEAPVTITYTEYSLREGHELGNALLVVMDLLIGRIKR